MDHTLRVVIIPFPAFGHLIPSFQLSIALARKGVRVFYISTPRNIQRLPRVPQDVSSLFKFVMFSFPDLYNEFLPNGAEATSDIREDGQEVNYLLDAYDHLQQPVKKFIVNETLDYIITDLNPWIIDIARECHVPLLYFSVVSSAASVFYGPPEYLFGEGQKASPETLTKPREWVGFPSLVAFHELEANQGHTFYHRTNASFDSLSERLAKVLDACQAVIIRSCHELEGNYGLELSGLPFFWTLRNHRWARDDLNVALPPGFAQRTAS